MHETMDDKNIIERGFTLIELLVVIAILGILAAVVVFAVGGITDRGATSACEAEVATVSTAIEAYFAQNEAYPAGPTLADLNTQLHGAGLISESSTIPGATATHAPAYTPAIGKFTATC